MNILTLNRKILFGIVGICFCALSFYSQHKISILADGGINKVHSVLKDSNSTTSANITATSHFGLSYNYKFSKNSIFGLDVMYSYMTNSETFQIYNTSNYIKNTINVDISYLVLPIYYGLWFKKFSFYFGPQFRFALYSKGHENGYSYKAPIILTWKSEEHLIKTTDCEFGTQASLGYEIFPKLSFYVKGYYGITNIFIDDLHKTSNNWQILVGIKYNFYSSKSKE